MNTKPLLAFLIVIFAALTMLIAQQKNFGVSAVNITAQDLDSWFKMLPPDQLRGIAAQPEPKKVLVDNLKEMFTLGQEAERVGLASTPEAQATMSIMEKTTLAGMYRNTKSTADPKLAEVSDQEKQDYLKNNPTAFDEFIVSNPRFKTIPEEQRKQLRPQFAELMILLDRAKKSGLDRDPGYQMMFRVQRASYLASLLQEKLRNSITVSDDEVKQQFESTKVDFTETRVRHILIMMPDQRKEREKNQPPQDKDKAVQSFSIKKPETKEEAKKLADELLTKLKAIPAASLVTEFSKMAQQYSDDSGSGKMGGDLGYVKKDVGFVEPFKQTVFKLQPGQLSDVVETSFGYHIIFIEDRKTPQAPDDVTKQEIKDKLIDKKLIEKVDALKAKSSVTIDENFSFPASASAPAPANSLPLGHPTPPPQNEQTPTQEPKEEKKDDAPAKADAKAEKAEKESAKPAK